MPDMTRTAWAGLVFEGAMILAGLWILWRQRPWARRTTPARLGAWDLPPVDFAAFLVFALLFAGVMTSIAGSVSRRAHMGDDAALVLGGGAMHLGVLAGLLAFHLAFGPRSGAPTLRPALLSGTVTFLVALPLVEGSSLVWQYLLKVLGLPAEGQDMVAILENSDSVPLKAGLLAVATLLVPITEEFLFRGGLFRYLRTRIPGGAAVALTSVIFGSLHVTWGAHPTGLPSLVPLIVLASVFCIAYERTGSLGTTIVAHALFNLNTFLIVATGLAS